MQKAALRVIADKVGTAIQGGLEQLRLNLEDVEIVVNRRGIKLFGLVIIPAVVSIVYERRNLGLSREVTRDFLTVDITPEGVFLTRNCSPDQLPSAEKIQNYLEEQNIFGIDIDNISKFARHPDGIKILVHEFNVIGINSVQPAFTVSRDRMRASIIKFDQAEVAYESLSAALADKGIREGLIGETLTNICSPGFDNILYLIAEGIEPVDDEVKPVFFNVEFSLLRPKHLDNPDDAEAR